jgi:hypothetical protein
MYTAGVQEEEEVANAWRMKGYYSPTHHRTHKLYLKEKNFPFYIINLAMDPSGHLNGLWNMAIRAAFTIRNRRSNTKYFIALRFLGERASGEVMCEWATMTLYIGKFTYIYVYITRISLKEREHEQRKADLYMYIIVHYIFFFGIWTDKRWRTTITTTTTRTRRRDIVHPSRPSIHVLHAVVKYLGSNKGDGTKVSEQATSQINYVSSNNSKRKRNLIYTTKNI